MFVSTSAGRSSNFERVISLTFVVFIVTAIEFNSAQQEFTSLIGVDGFTDAAIALFPLNIVERLSSWQTDEETKNVVSPKCLNQTKLMKEQFKNRTLWALKMVDASSKIPSGLLTGNLKDLGMYDECVAVDVVQDGEWIRGRHCMYNVLLGKGGILKGTLSICVPSGCEPADVQDLLNSSFHNVAGVDVSVTEVTCSAVDPREWTFGGIVTVFGFTVLFLFLIICTICDFMSMHLINKFGRSNGLAIIIQFSLYANARRIFTTKTSPQTLPAIQGMRFFSMVWVILGHTYWMNSSAPLVNRTDMIEWTYSWQSLYIIVATFSVDTFFTISGFLMSYLFLKEMSNGRSFDIIAYYSHRYLRLTPAFAALLLIMIFILPRMGSGALWETMSTAEEDTCRKSWWSMLLYLQNYVNQGCLSHTWYLAAEMHYFWISPIILYPLAKKPKIGVVILSAFFVASIITPTAISYGNKFTNSLFSNGDGIETKRTMQYFYMASHARAAPWVIGVIFGYLVFTYKGPSKKRTRWIGWILCIAAFAFCIFSQRKFQQKDYVYDEVWETFYTAVARPFWAAAVAWIIYASVRGFGGPVATFLSLSIFHPLSRLSYCMYLVHYVIQSTKIRAARMPRFFSDFGPINDFLSDLVLSIIVAFLFSLMFESPILILEKLVRTRNGRKTNESSNGRKHDNLEKGIDNPGLTLDR